MITRSFLFYNKPYRVFACRSFSSAWQEIQIPVPWGHVAGKWWGPQDKRPILACHGWQDNSGTFDTLIPLLPRTSSFLAIDFPGNGLSSKYPPGMYYHFIDSVILLRRIVQYFKWPKVSLLGHSMGAICSYAYTMYYPKEVDFLMCLDALSPIPSDIKSTDEYFKHIDNFLEYDNLNSANEEPPCYSYEDLEKRMFEGYRQSIDLNKCKHILERKSKPSKIHSDKYYFTSDLRTKAYSLRWNGNDLNDNAPRLTCPILLVKFSRSPFFRHKGYATEIIKIISRCNQDFHVHEVNGAHHLHLNNPEQLKSIINQFISTYDIEERLTSGLQKENIALSNSC